MIMIIATTTMMTTTTMMVVCWSTNDDYVDTMTMLAMMITITIREQAKQHYLFT